jgi:protein-arginine kinase
MYEDALKDKENAVLKMIQIEEDKKKIFVEKELLTGKLIENNKVQSILNFYIVSVQIISNL